MQREILIPLTVQCIETKNMIVDSHWKKYKYKEVSVNGAYKLLIYHTYLLIINISCAAEEKYAFSINIS